MELVEGQKIVYCGFIKDGKRHGLGKLTDTISRITYDGQWRDGSKLIGRVDRGDSFYDGEWH